MDENGIQWTIQEIEIRKYVSKDSAFVRYPVSHTREYRQFIADRFLSNVAILIQATGNGRRRLKN